MSARHDGRQVTSRIARSPEELFPLLEHCRAGKLKEVDEWIAAGQPLDFPRTGKRPRRRSPMEIAIEKGFFALAELLLQGGSSADEGTLEFAVAHRQTEIVKLLLKRGITATGISGYTAFDGGAEVVRLLIDHGFDPTAEFAFYHALCGHVQGNLVLLKEHKSRFPDLQRQAEMALVHHCQKGSSRAIGLLLWAGVRPDAQVPRGTERYDAEMTTTALEEAAHAGNLTVLKQLKPERYPDSIREMLGEVWLKPSQEMIDCLLGLGALLNDQPTGGSSLLRSLIGSLSFESRGIFGTANTAQIESLFKIIEHMVRLGAKWIPDPEESVRHQRSRLRDIKPDNLVKLFRVLKEGNAASIELLDDILDSPSFKRHLDNRLRKNEQVLHPPPPPVPTPTAENTVKDVPAKPRPSMIDQKPRAEEFLLDAIRRKPVFPFTRIESRLSLHAQTARRRLGLPRDDKDDLMPIFSKAAEGVNKRVQTFSVELDDGQWHSSDKYFSVRLKTGHEWPDVVKESWTGVDSPNPYLLTEIGSRLLERIRSGQLASGFTEASAISIKIGLGRYENSLERYLLEIDAKSPLDLQWEEQRSGHYGPVSYRIWIGDTEKQKDKPRGVNPQFEVDLKRFGKAEIDAARKMLHELVVQIAPTGTEPLYILAISTRQHMADCFPRSETVDCHALVSFFGALTFNDSLRRGYNFHSDADQWSFVLKPKAHWATSIAAIQDELTQPTLEARYGLSTEAARLLRWVQTIQPDQMLGCFTPNIEDQRERGIGIASPWGNDNFPAYLQMLVEELNEKTHYDLRLQPWKEYSATKTRLKVATKICDLDDVLENCIKSPQCTVSPSTENQHGAFWRISRRENVRRQT